MTDTQPGTPPQEVEQPQQSDILSQNQRTEQELLLRHPFYSAPELPTSPAIQAYLMCKDEFLYGASGFTLLGERGSGRKIALLVIRNLFQHEFPELATATWAPLPSELTTAAGTWRSLLAAVNHRFWGGASQDITSRLEKVIEERTAITGVYRFVLFVQNIETVDGATLEALAGLRDSLQVKGIQLFVVGSSEINAFRARTDGMTGPTKETIESLLGSGHVLRPLTSALDLVSVLHALDTLPYPDAGGVTWVQFFVPRAFAAGFRLSDQVATLKGAVDAYAANGRVTARFIFKTIKRMLGEASKVDQPGLTIGVDQWKRAMGLVLGDGITYLPAPTEE
ncbi:hypothetical protein R8871_04778 [Paraburkholderia graminis C4D1M]|uniref:STAS domain-containing protein n=1 Tax=Paraburkholderia graminis (strain ATCC 700544 / DSM 17151 / LMG 18924 / NCIMB 13744 / C4D1M) TaxID=396598 RepID=B1G9T9_PARG4|nr:hypothetical protein [Paraburkholderia graminis]EDT07087.1 hypothetical protein BgramDRAFT_6109 [Paraburkholderia graminis C4D1M]CAB3720076.1 hypothetical protein R8871_04778 [Paraburkholderia graminis C4D1M]